MLSQSRLYVSKDEYFSTKQLNEVKINNLQKNTKLCDLTNKCRKTLDNIMQKINELFLNYEQKWCIISLK